jgi:hypothetical protein
MLDAHLRRAVNVAGGMECHADPVQVDRLTVFHGLYARGWTEPGTQDVTPVMRGEVMARSPPRVISVRVGDHGAIDGRPGVDKEAAGFAVEAPVRRAQEQRYLWVAGRWRAPDVSPGGSSEI